MDFFKYMLGGFLFIFSFAAFMTWVSGSPAPSALQTTCLHGYVFVINDNNPRQMIDQYGHGVKCEEG